MWLLERGQAKLLNYLLCKSQIPSDYGTLYVKDLLPVGWMAAVAVQTKLHLLGPFVLIHTRMHTPTQTHNDSECVLEKKEALLFGGKMVTGEGSGPLLI